MMHHGILLDMVDARPAPDTFLHEVLKGLGAPRKTLPSKYLYDATGSQLFEEICRLPEYYPTSTELGILRTHASEMAALIGPRALLIEPGSGGGTKTRLLLEAMDHPSAYVPIELSADSLLNAVCSLSQQFPILSFMAVCADFSADFEMPVCETAHEHCAVFFPGSTLGNFGRPERRTLLKRLSGLCAGQGGLLIGLDLQKDAGILERAYNDSRGITARFNLNLLRRINRELDGTFDLATFVHRAIYNPLHTRIEMHLMSLTEQMIQVAGHPFFFREDETILTEYSYKFDLKEFQAEAASIGLDLTQAWTDPAEWFAIVHLAPSGNQRVT